MNIWIWLGIIVFGLCLVVFLYWQEGKKRADEILEFPERVQLVRRTHGKR